MTEDDYNMSVLQVVERLHPLLDFKNITLVAHSIGSFYALKLVELYPNQFNKLLLIDPTSVVLRLADAHIFDSTSRLVRSHI